MCYVVLPRVVLLLCVCFDLHLSSYVTCRSGVFTLNISKTYLMSCYVMLCHVDGCITRRRVILFTLSKYLCFILCHGMKRHILCLYIQFYVILFDVVCCHLFICRVFCHVMCRHVSPCVVTSCVSLTRQAILFCSVLPLFYFPVQFRPTSVFLNGSVHTLWSRSRRCLLDGDRWRLLPSWQHYCNAAKRARVSKWPLSCPAG